MTRAASTSPLVLVVFLVTMGNVAGRVAADLGIPGKSWPTKRTPDTEFEAHAESEHNLQRATFGAGCYWGTEKYFADNMETKCPGCVRATRVGFMGPTQPKEGEYPTYNEVCTGRTGCGLALGGWEVAEGMEAGRGGLLVAWDQWRGKG